ncbi:MAG: insulinase family protein [Planctomycetes bacterium]|nr:insulinase family protein [Planctomycetota bacterium]MCP4771950.1 insulinase family protein [Planctomycetota bacterium]MCP4860399.1 insulinase family protein [Planctomycetota bacterium]
MEASTSACSRALLPVLLAPFLLTLTASSSLAQEPQPAGTVAPWAHDSSDLTVDERIHYGALENGMRFAWADNPEPNNRVYLRLHVDAGSFGETATELGMAHFLEHMAFNGSENFEAGTLIEWFQDNGMSFGADTNAHTAFSETVYKLDMPNRDEKTIRDGLQVMRDFAGKLNILEAEVQAEKGVIDGEQRERDSAGFRAFVKVLDRQYAGTRYATRLPIGTKEVRDEFTAETVRAFYERFYRPENMTMIIVGDLQGYNPEALIHEYFGDFAPPASPIAPEPAWGTPTMENLVFAVYDAEIPSVQIAIGSLRIAEEKPDTVAQRQADLARTVAHSMLNLRFSELVKKPETSFLGASASDAGQLEVFEGGSLNVSADPAKWEAATTEAYIELRKALNFGFQQAELDEVRANLMRGLDEAVEREATAHSSGLREAILLEVESDVVPTSAATDRSVYLPALEALTVEDCLQALRSNWRGGKMSIIANGGLQLENAAAELERVVAAAKKIEIKRSDAIEQKPFAYGSDKEKTGEIVRQEKVEDLGLWMVEFANGVRLNIKKTDFKKNTIIMSGRVGEGLLAVPNDQLLAASLADTALSGGGLIEHTVDELRRLMAGKQVGVSLALADDHFALSGGTTSEDLLLEFELACAHLQHLAYRPDMLDMIKQQIPLFFNQLDHTPNGPLWFDFTPAVLQGNPRASLLGLQPFPQLEELLAIEIDQIKAAIAGHLVDAPIELTVVGDLEVNDVIAMAAQTFGMLPKRRAAKDVSANRGGIAIAEGVYMERTVDTADKKATVMMLFPTTDGFDDSRRRNLSFLGTVVDDRLRLEVRERLGAAYSPGAGAESSQVYPGLGGVMIQAAGNPDKVEELVDACRAVAADLATNGVTEEEVQRLSEPILNQLRDAQRNNAYWMNLLTEAQSRPESLQSARTVVSFYENLSAADLSALAAEYLKPERASVLVVLPEIEEVVEEVIEEDIIEEPIIQDVEMVDEAEPVDEPVVDEPVLL